MLDLRRIANEHTIKFEVRILDHASLIGEHLGHAVRFSGQVGDEISKSSNSLNFQCSSFKSFACKHMSH